ncbi:MAG: peptide chain release factor N(5)-glutamine methyltransferase [Armatimonadota bacterium]|nr:peptide chain release factor N(5)-glutamine methyltransferase [Armatimonadota bacterium]MDR7389272.1 peptide chain release factor N(5)-glutamine methyltransferase [Armatimonadota bacterium]MDR7391882.1 peptide chain release factor N(5)-glutamine methyltransferase [Armatimonadota bacterium]MDR7394261.1 peptide chain release factor N(5)-glutamine methyltransferase [Armatimonadota bacterium]MDR7399138.1 peptide chain release factor N(5)-glutamine methyltransferase [Armatimonadota bacterium]
MRPVPPRTAFCKSAVPSSVREAYLWGREHLSACGVEAAALEAEVLLRCALGVTRAQLYVRWPASVEEGAWRRYVELLEQRGSGRPLAYLVGEREFCGLPFWVDERVLVPRPETEHLVEVVLEATRDVKDPAYVDVGTGSGAVAVALAVRRPDATVYATDVSRDALAVAERNAGRHGVSGRVQLLHGDALEPLLQAGLRAHAVAANPPYVPPSARSELPPEVLAEPEVAVFAPGPRGVELHERIADQARAVLRESGVLALEVAAKWDQARQVMRTLERMGYREVRAVRDLAGLERVVVARWR